MTEMESKAAGEWDPAISYARYSANFMTTEKISKTTYIVMKFMDAAEFLNWHPEFKKLYEKNGFVFLKREIKI